MIVNLIYVNLTNVNLAYVNQKYWCIQLSMAKTVEVLKLDLKIDVELVFQRLLDLCSQANRDEKIKLCCRSKVIKVDESLVFKIKYKRTSGLNESKLGALEPKNLNSPFNNLFPL